MPRTSWLKFLWLPICLLALLASGYFVWQLRGQSSPSLAGPLAAEKGYGVTLDLTLYDDTGLATTLAELQQHGLVWLRQPVAWADVEPVAGEFEWVALDRVMAAVEQANASPLAPGQEFRVIVVLHTSPAWTRPAGTSLTTPPTEVSDFGNFAQAFAARYGATVDHYQIWHEPNLSANWGDTFVDPAAYANLLREASLTIREADPQAIILTAALAPTLEDGPLNLNELAYLDRLYQAQAHRWFDVVAGQPYGFDSEPTDSAVGDQLNFRRLELLREVMLAHGDASTPIWATAFGWNVLPDDWQGQPSPWKSDTPAVQAERTATALDFTRREWPWVGPLLAVRWDTLALADDDPARGFALQKMPALLTAFQHAIRQRSTIKSGLYPAHHPLGQYSSGWRFAATQADIPRHEPRTLTLPFEGTRLDLTVNRGAYRGYLWVTVDGQAANALPQNEAGQSYVVLYDPLRESETVTLARYLADGPHTAVVEAEGGWGQWAIDSWAVYREADTRLAEKGLTVAGVIAVLSGLGVVGQILRNFAAVAKQLWAWSEIVVALYAILGERGQIIVTFGLAIAFYLAPGSISLLLLPCVALTLLLRPGLGLALIAFSLSLFQAPKHLPIGGFSPVELALVLTLAGFIFRGLLALGHTVYAEEDADSSQSPIHNLQSLITNLQPADWAALTLLFLAFLATLAAGNFGVSMREWRVVVLGSVLFYFLVRLGADFGPAMPADPSSWRWVWRLMDAFVAGAVLQAIIALYLYFFTDQSITAEGVRRALGFAYGSPNNLSLFLDRAWPILLGVALLSGTLRMRRVLYGLGWLIVSLTLYLTFSKGALLMGLPAGLIGMAGLYAWQRREGWGRSLAVAGGGLLLLLAALIPLSQTARFRTTFDLSQGSTGFFRLKLWQASLTMLQERWPLGVGLDNFLYEYRTRYILPEAWQEPDLSHPHNLILDFGTRIGIGGIFILLWLQAAFWGNAWRLYQRTTSPLILGLMGSMLIFLTHGLVDNSYFLVDLAFVFFLTVGVVQRLSEQFDD